MPHFPMFIDLKDQPVLVIGGGTIALRKLQKLAPYEPVCKVIAPDISSEIAAIPGIELHCRRFREQDLYPRPALVIAATDDAILNHDISRRCRKRHIPVNVVDDPAACSFIFPALVQKGSFSAGITTCGASPSATVYFKNRLQEMLPENLDVILSWLEAQRPALKASVPEQKKRSGIFRRMFEACMKKGGPLTDAESERCMKDEESERCMKDSENKRHSKDAAHCGANPLNITDIAVADTSSDTSSAPSSCQLSGSVALVGAGCGKADLITVRGLKLLHECQAVVYDDLIDPALLDEAPPSAQRIYMGKRSGAHSAPQSEINQKLIDLARAGLKVVRLKGGDPYLFGRGGEEMLALKKAGIPCQEVPGISSAIGIPAEVGIPVTHRGISRGLHIVTAHTTDTPDGLPADFDHLANLSGTLVFLMGLKQLPLIASRLMAAGKSGDTPAAVISGGNSQNPAFVRAPLSELPQAAACSGVLAPAIILVGEVAALDLSTVTDALEEIYPH